MLAIDTNILVRLFARDDPAQTKAAEKAVENGGWIGHIVLVEALWVLDVGYSFAKARVIQVIEELLKQRDLIVQDADVVIAALDLYNASKKVEFADCLILANSQKGGHMPLATFDRALAKVQGAVLIS